MPLRQSNTDGFTRSLVRDGERVLIESKCEYCGAVLVGSVPQLPLDEEQHRAQCAGRAKQAANGR